MGGYGKFLLMLAIGVVLLFRLSLQTAVAQSAPYQAYKISYGCLYVVSNAMGGIAVAVTPSVGGICQ
jgi:hypothetical protein